jgi:peptidoglycan-associated lipoprotein
MVRPDRLLAGLAMAAVLLAAAACSKPKPVIAPEPPAAAPSQAPAAGTIEGSEAASEVRSEPALVPAGTPESGVLAGELPADLAELNRAGYLTDAFFDTNKADLRDDAREALAADAAWLRAHPTVRILVEGHCDERNTTEYNLALGWRRANAVKDYLTSLGVEAARLSTISYGEERPFAACHDESCWSQNRRAHLVITAR